MNGILECSRCGGAVELDECIDESNDGFTELYRCVQGCGTGTYSVDFSSGDDRGTGVLR